MAKNYVGLATRQSLAVTVLLVFSVELISNTGIVAVQLSSTQQRTYRDDLSTACIFETGIKQRSTISW